MGLRRGNRCHGSCAPEGLCQGGACVRELIVENGSVWSGNIVILQVSSLGAVQVLRNADGGGGGVSDFLGKSVTKV